MSARALELAGLDGGDVASASHPYLHLAAARARRARTARLTPGGLPQPPEVMGVGAAPRVPNALQPMSGELAPGQEVGEGRPAYFGAMMPPPTGVSNGQMDQTGGLPFGAPTGMPAEATGSDRFEPNLLAGLGPQTAELPRFAVGGVLSAGGSGMEGESGPEVITALPAGGVQVQPTGVTGAADLSGLDRAYGASPSILDATPAGGRLQQLEGRQAALAPLSGEHATASKTQAIGQKSDWLQRRTAELAGLEPLYRAALPGVAGAASRRSAAAAGV